MNKSYKVFSVIIILFFSCKKNDYSNNKIKVLENKEVLIQDFKKKEKVLNDKKEENHVKLDNDNIIPFLSEFGKNNIENKVRIITKYGNIDIKLFNETPFHRANFIYLTKINYFNGTVFHRVVKDFIIQGGNSDSYEISKRRRKIGRYLIPPDSKKGFKHHRGIISTPVSDIKNPHKLASPYEFFIVQSKNGAYHLDSNYTPFGKVINGIEVVDLISNLKTDKSDWPLDDVEIKIEILN